MLGAVDAILQRTPEVDGFSRRTGAELGFFLTETNRGDYAVRLRGAARGAASKRSWTVCAGASTTQVPGLRVEFVQILQDMIGDLSGNPSPIEIKLFGERPGGAAAGRARWPRRADRARAAASSTTSTASPRSGRPTTSTSTSVAPRWSASTRTRCSTGWRPPSPARVVGQVLEGDRAIPLRVRYPRRFRDRLEALGGLTLVTPQRRLAPLRSRRASGCRRRRPCSARARTCASWCGSRRGWRGATSAR